MTVHDDIRFTTRSQILTEKWDHCIENASNGLIYGYSYYLDHMAKHWDGLIMGDYEAVMPLTWNRKWGINYLYQPPLTPQLGIFSGKLAEPALVNAFLSAIPKNFLFAEIFLNYGNEYPTLKKQDNFVLNLNDSYESIAANYKKDLRNNLKRSSKLQLTYGVYDDLPKALSIHQAAYQHRVSHVRLDDYKNFETLCHFLQGRNAIGLRAVWGNQKELLSIGLLLRNGKRLSLIESTTPAQGRRVGANHFLLDSIIQEFSSMDLVLDFEGSDLAGVAHFYKNFGPSNEPYFFYYLNRLPWPLKYFK